MALNPKSRAGASSRDLRGRIHISHNSLSFLSCPAAQDGECVCGPRFWRRGRVLSAAIVLTEGPHGGPFTARREESPQGSGTEALGRGIYASRVGPVEEDPRSAAPQCGAWSRRGQRSPTPWGTLAALQAARGPSAWGLKSAPAVSGTPD